MTIDYERLANNEWQGRIEWDGLDYVFCVFKFGRRFRYLMNVANAPGAKVVEGPAVALIQNGTGGYAIVRQRGVTVGDFKATMRSREPEENAAFAGLFNGATRAEDRRLLRLMQVQPKLALKNHLQLRLSPGTLAFLRKAYDATKSRKQAVANTLQALTQDQILSR